MTGRNDEAPARRTIRSFVRRAGRITPSQERALLLEIVELEEPSHRRGVQQPRRHRRPPVEPLPATLIEHTSGHPPCVTLPEAPARVGDRSRR